MLTLYDLKIKLSKKSDKLLELFAGSGADIRKYENKTTLYERVRQRRRIYNQQYYEKHKIEISILQHLRRKWLRKNDPFWCERQRAYRRKYYYAHREELNAKKRQLYRSDFLYRQKCWIYGKWYRRMRRNRHEVLKGAQS